MARAESKLTESQLSAALAEEQERRLGLVERIEGMEVGAGRGKRAE
jgi:hypothetical protein